MPVAGIRVRHLGDGEPLAGAHGLPPQQRVELAGAVEGLELVRSADVLPRR
jgi:hypothetical protein